jgi:hypothetical protein
MIAVDAQAMFAIAAIITSMSSLIWSVRRSPTGSGPDDGAASDDAGRTMASRPRPRITIGTGGDHALATVRHGCPGPRDGASG